MSITGFKAYIDSPFHYYFNRVLEAEVLDDRALELDNLQFGTMIHDVLQEFGDSPHKNSDNPAEIAGFCLKKLDALLARRLNSAKYGIPKLQAEIMEANLQYFAEAQAENSANGWRILFTEKDVSFQWNELFRKVFPDTPEESWRSEIAVRGKLDRIDCHEGNGAWRIVDYKTNKESKSPAAEHIGGGNTETDDWRVAYTDEKGKRRYWKDLQLPLYLCAVKYGLIPGISMDEKALIGAAYFNLPLAYTFTGIQVFNELNQLPGLCGSAVLCADNILRRIFVEHCSWPPGRPGNPLYDELASYIGPYSAEQFDPVFIEALSAGKGES